MNTAQKRNINNQKKRKEKKKQKKKVKKDEGSIYKLLTEQR